MAIVNQSVAQRLFPNGDALNRRLMPTNLGTNLGSPPPGRIVGVVADVDEDNVVQEPSMIVYYPTARRRPAACSCVPAEIRARSSHR